jgi:hypothetical protein
LPEDVAMDLRFKDELALMPDLGHQLRRLRWFRATFRANARAVASAYGLRFEIDDTRLAKAFLDWIETVETERRFAAVDRADFIVFAAGLVLRELIRQNPAKAMVPATPPAATDDRMTEIVRFWPEGFLYTNYCVSAIAAIHEQEFGAAPTIDACADDLRTWWSYRENATEMPSNAVAFLDRFLGAEPNWILPDSARSRQAMRDALDAGRSRGIANH